jgi:hypothetical protein
MPGGNRGSGRPDSPPPWAHQGMSKSASPRDEHKISTVDVATMHLLLSRGGFCPDHVMQQQDAHRELQDEEQVVAVSPRFYSFAPPERANLGSPMKWLGHERVSAGRDGQA